jgi:hypothetical protein
VPSETQENINARELADLRYHWGESYIIDVRFPSAWTARRLDDHEALSAASAADLRALMRRDHAERPVARHE